MKVRRRKNLFGIAVNFESAVAIVNDHIVIDAKIGVVVVFVFASNLDDSAINKLIDGLSKSLEAPDRLIIHVGVVEDFACPPGGCPTRDHRFPKRNVHLVGIVFPKTPVLRRQVLLA